MNETETKQKQRFHDLLQYNTGCNTVFGISQSLINWPLWRADFGSLGRPLVALPTLSPLALVCRHNQFQASTWPSLIFLVFQSVRNLSVRVIFPFHSFASPVYVIACMLVFSFLVHNKHNWSCPPYITVSVVFFLLNHLNLFSRLRRNTVTWQRRVNLWTVCRDKNVAVSGFVGFVASSKITKN